jgi:hypothetical protein
MNRGGAPLPCLSRAGSARLSSCLPSSFSRRRTYAPWYDAARFDQRTHPVFNLRAQLRQLAVNLQSLKEELLGAGAALLVALLILACYTAKASLRNLASTWFCTLPVIAVFGMYLLLHLLRDSCSVFRWCSGRRVRIGSCAFRTGRISTARHAGWNTGLCGEHDPRSASLCRITAQGIGCATWLLPRPFPTTDSHPARRSQVSVTDKSPIGHTCKGSVVAEVWSIDSARFWSEPSTAQQAVLHSMADAGAKAVIWRADSDQACAAEWISLPEHSGCVIFAALIYRATLSPLATLLR